MRRLIAVIGGTVFGSLLLVAAVAAADPTPTPSPTPSPSATAAAAHGQTVATVLGLTPAQVTALRHEGRSLAQIAESQKVAVQSVVDALVARWSERIDARVANGALTQTEATQLQTQLETRAASMVSSTTPGGVQGAAVGAGPQNGAGNGDVTRARDGSGAGSGAGNGAGNGIGDGTCDGTGPHGAGQS
jgi:hypothetical protein